MTIHVFTDINYFAIAVCYAFYGIGLYRKFSVITSVPLERQQAHRAIIRKVILVALPFSLF